jgi:purine-nucleoside phosphorylase
MSTDLVTRVDECVDAVRAHSPSEPRVGLVLGTGLGGLAELIDVESEIPYGELPGFPTTPTAAHAGRLVVGTLNGTAVVAMQGRFHRYEGHTLQDVGFPVRVLARLGVDTLIVTNVSGGLNPLWRLGELVLIDDHINLLGDSPLVGPNDESLGPRFPDMSEPYDRTLQRLAMEVALELGLRLARGVYVAVAGPQLETRAEYRMLRSLGADLVGMSTVPEVIVARHMGVRVLGLSIVTDLCLPDALRPVDVAEILAVAASAEPSLIRLVERVVTRL